MIDLEQGSLIPQACFTLAEGIDPASNRRHLLADIEVQPFDKRRVDRPATPCQHLLNGQREPNTTRCVTPTMRWRRYDLTTCA